MVRRSSHFGAQPAHRLGQTAAKRKKKVVPGGGSAGRVTYRRHTSPRVVVAHAPAFSWTRFDTEGCYEELGITPCFLCL